MASSSSSSSSGCWKYDVFLSFRGEDTRKIFVDHLYSALEQHGILTYKDDVTLERGDTIGPSLLKAIESAHILVIVFSKNYADSSWCLDELTHIMKCKDSERGQIVMPIFYHVDPSDVRKQRRKYGEAFAKHELSGDKHKVESWKKTLVDASNIAGWEPKHVANGHEAKCIKEIVDSILDKVSSLNPLVDNGDLVGMGTRLKDLRSQLRIGSGGVRMVGIWGMGGGGKTTLATSLFMKLKFSGKFHVCCFVENIREESKQQNGLKGLQKRILLGVFGKNVEVESVEIGKQMIKSMLCRRNVLIVLDDVDHIDQLKALAGRGEWFGDGSRIIITTRDEHLLKTHRVDVVHHISLLSHDEAIQLFNKHAYNEDNLLKDYEMLSEKIVSYADGLPLALMILGSFLYDKDNDEWIGTLSRLKDYPEMDIVEKLRISYDGLKPVEKELFLDIACFFRGEMKAYAMEILDAYGFHPHIGVKVLIQKSLIIISHDGKFDMHDMVQEMGHYIVRGEHPNNPEKRSRVWREEDIEDICSRNATEENDKIQAVDCVVSRNYSSNFIMLVSNLKKLRFLKVRTLFESFNEEGPSFLSNELRCIDLEGYAVGRFLKGFQPTKLVVLRMSGSLQSDLWKGYKYLPCLKELELYEMEELVRTPDFGGLPSLQKLSLFECGKLEEIHQSLGNHSSLVFVQVRYCDKLKRFPAIVGMEKLEILKIEYCRAIVEFPTIEAKIDNLVELHSSKVVPSTLVEYCTNRISLRNLDLSGCGLKDGEIPSQIGELSNLQELNLSFNHFTRIDFSLLRLARLKLLELTYCSNLVELSELPSSLAILKADGCRSLEVVIKDEIHTNCKWLSQVSITRGRWGVREKMVGGERLLETMLQGNGGVESGCMFLNIEGSEMARGFIPRLVRGNKCRMQLPDNWFSDFSGLLLCATSTTYFYRRMISMKHVEKLEVDSQHEDDEAYWEEEAGDADSSITWAGYISFEILRNTLWWNHTSISTFIQVEIDEFHCDTIGSDTIGCGLKLVPKRRAAESSGSSSTQTETTRSSSSSYSDDDYKCKLNIHHDSMSALECSLDWCSVDQLLF